MEIVKSLKVMQPDGTYSEPIDIGAKAENVSLAEGVDVEAKIADMVSDIETLQNAGYITKEVADLTNYYDKTTIDSKLDLKANTADVEKTYAKKTEITDFITKDAHNLTYYYDKDQIDSKLASAIHYKGEVNDYSDLAALEEIAETGDMYNIKNASENNKAGDNAVWNGSAWDILSGIIDLTDYVKKDELSSLVDLSNYYTKEETYSKDEIDSQISGLIGQDLKDYLKKTEAEAEYAKLTALDDYVTKTAADDTYAKKTDLNGYAKLSAANTFAAANTFNNDVKFGSTDFKIANTGAATLKSVNIDQACTISYDSTNECLKFEFI